jgi:hypothetical protein
MLKTMVVKFHLTYMRKVHPNYGLRSRILPSPVECISISSAA